MVMLVNDLQLHLVFLEVFSNLRLFQGQNHPTPYFKLIYIHLLILLAKSLMVFIGCQTSLFAFRCATQPPSQPPTVLCNSAIPKSTVVSFIMNHVRTMANSQG